MSDRSCPSIYCEEYQRIVDRVNSACNPTSYHKACQELLIYVDLHIDSIRQAYEARGMNGAFQPIQVGTMVFCKVEDHLIRSGRVYGHRLTEIGGQDPKLEYWIELYYRDGDLRGGDTNWISSDDVFDKAEEAFA